MLRIAEPVSGESGVVDAGNRGSSVPPSAARGAGGAVKRIPWDAALVERLAGVTDVKVSHHSYLDGDKHTLWWKWPDRNVCGARSCRPWTVRSAVYRITGCRLSDGDIEEDGRAE